MTRPGKRDRDPWEVRRKRQRRGAIEGGAAVKKRQELGLAPTGYTSDRLLDDDEWEFCKAVAEFRTRTGIRFPTLSQYLFVIKGLGYRKLDADHE